MGNNGKGSALFNFFLSVFLFSFSENILEIVGVAPLLMDYAKTYLKIVGGFCFLNALIPIFSSYLRAFGYAKQPLIATLLANIVNLLLNVVFLFVFHMYEIVLPACVHVYNTYMCVPACMCLYVCQ